LVLCAAFGQVQPHGRSPQGRPAAGAPPRPEGSGVSRAHP
jgi:hypothetical protein